jgi:hypothetical protein
MVVSDDFEAFARSEDCSKSYISQALGVRTSVLGEYHTGVMRVKFIWA